MIYVSTDELNTFQIAKQLTHCTSYLFKLTICDKKITVVCNVVFSLRCLTGKYMVNSVMPSVAEMAQGCHFRLQGSLPRRASSATSKKKKGTMVGGN